MKGSINGQEFPAIRIKKAVLNNFKSVEHGEIVFNCGKSFIPRGTVSDILGIYGQNGSGKTALIEALSILRCLLTSSRIGDEYADCISASTNDAVLEFYFDLQYPCGEIREVIYLFHLKRVPLTEEEISIRNKNAQNSVKATDSISKVCVYNEQFWLSWTDETGVPRKSQRIIDTECNNAPFGPDSKRNLFYSRKKHQLILEIIKSKAYDNSQSFIFHADTLKTFSDNGIDSVFLHVLIQLRFYGNFYLFVIDNNIATAFISLNYGLPIYTQSRPYYFYTIRTNSLSDKEHIVATKAIDGISTVLNQLVPGLAIALKKIGTETRENGETGNVVSLVSYRNGVELPLHNESDGVKKLISILSLITAAFCCESCTVAIDEFDSGIYEYLLGEILQIFEESGKGQFIFTSHNLRPLEVIDKKFIYFTTTNPKNRYIHLKGVGNTNNLRDVYFREILVGEQPERIYNKTKRHKIIAAFLKVGSDEGDGHG